VKRKARIAEIRIYVEGGGDGGHTKRRLRVAFGEFFRELRELARARKVHWEIIPCGSRGSAFEDYQVALRSHPHAVNLLLVDSETAVSAGSPWQHLKSDSGDNWDNPGVEDKHCHLMVQATEAWLIADPDALRQFYGKGFHAKSLPSNPNVEQIEKQKVLESMRRATRHTTKGEYHKTKHAPMLLERVCVRKVRHCAPFCKRLFDTVTAEIDRF
jgi:hypothetical protein